MIFRNIGRSSNWLRCNSSKSTSTTTNITGISLLLSVGTTTLHNQATHTHSLWQSNSNLLTNCFSKRTMATETSQQTPKKKHTNRLAQEKSPYLLQHAHNPVDWYPWGDEAIERARSENKLIFLSVGYSTCHWCHVMERESFENEAVAAIMNENFINIKVDREERPDIDKIYMQFVVMMNGSGGWPMSVWLTPDLAPITAGTYFPPTDRWGMPSFTTILKNIAAKWSAKEADLKSAGLQVIEAIRKTSSEKATETIFEPGSVEATLQEALRFYKQRFDPSHGGFGIKPKFPEVSRLNFLFHAYIITKDMDVLDIALQTLQHIGKGGIHDHVFGGFSRYSVDRIWHVPHFEKMLYDQGQLMTAYANAYKLSHQSSFLRYADGIFRYLMKDLRHPSGGFYAGEDADSLPEHIDKLTMEGAFYAWTWAEVKEAVTENASLYEGFESARAFEIYAFHYDLRPRGNVDPPTDPHLNGKNILIVRGSDDETCSNFNITNEQLTHILNTTNEVLHRIRDQRPRPHLDTKIIASWNGLLLSGLSELANCGSTKREEYMQVANQLVDFVRKNLYDSQRKLLLRSCYGMTKDNTALEDIATKPIDGFLDDYAFLIKGLLDYYKASLDTGILQWARELQDIQDSLFWDEAHGAYFYSQANSPNVIVRLKEDHDGAEPCGNSVSARNLLLLSHYFDEESYRQRADKVFNFFADSHPFGYTLPEMTSALLLQEYGLDVVAVVGPDNDDTCRQFVDICRKFYIPGMIILHVNPQNPGDACNERVQEKFKMVNGQPTVYICHDKVCRMPVTDPVKLEEALTENFFKSRI